jgi:hypothetical protein
MGTLSGRRARLRSGEVRRSGEARLGDRAKKGCAVEVIGAVVIFGLLMAIPPLIITPPILYYYRKSAPLRAEAALERTRRARARA